MAYLRNFFHWVLLVGSAIVVCLFLGLVLVDIVAHGYPVLSWRFLFSSPAHGMTEGGVLPALAGTVFLTLLTALFAVPFGVACAIYLSEYSRPGIWTHLIRVSIRNLAGIPSIIYGLFGLAIFVESAGLGPGMLSASLTLGLLSLPYIITSAEEALKNVPRALREASLAMGITQAETIRDIVVPQAAPGILTGIILALSRAAGETAPILFTGAVFYVNRFSTSLRDEFMALPYHIYVLATQHTAVEEVRPLAYGTCLVLILIVFVLNYVAISLRGRWRSRGK